MTGNHERWLRRGFLMLVLLCLIQPLWAIREERVQMKWGELNAVVSGKKITTVLRDGTAIEGKVLQVGPDALQIDVSKGSGSYGMGRGSIPRSQISVLRIETTSGSWRALGAAIGGGAGAAAGAAVYSRFSNEADSGTGAAIAAGLIGGGAVAGYLAGRSADRKALIILVVD